jgi:hypothetical protein
MDSVLARVELNSQLRNEVDRLSNRAPMSRRIGQSGGVRQRHSQPQPPRW